MTSMNSEENRPPDGLEQSEKKDETADPLDRRRGTRVRGTASGEDWCRTARAAVRGTDNPGAFPRQPSRCAATARRCDHADPSDGRLGGHREALVTPDDPRPRCPADRP